MVDGRLDVRQDDAVQKFKDAAFNKDFPIKTRSMILVFTAGKNVHDHHFMGLLIQFRKALGPDMIVPALNMGSFKDKFNKIPGKSQGFKCGHGSSFPLLSGRCPSLWNHSFDALIIPFSHGLWGHFSGLHRLFHKKFVLFSLFFKNHGLFPQKSLYKSRLCYIMVRHP